MTIGIGNEWDPGDPPEIHEEYRRELRLKSKRRTKVNTTAVAIAALKAKRDRLLAEIEPLNTAIQALGGGSGKTKTRGGGGWPKGKPRGPKKAMTEAQKAGLLKAQEARRAKSGKANGEDLANAEPRSGRDETQAPRKGASLSQSA